MMVNYLHPRSVVTLLVSIHGVLSTIPDCSIVSSSYSTVLTACDISDIRELHSSVFMDLGSPRLCSSGCVQAMNTLNFHAYDCSSAELNVELGFSDTKSALLNATIVQDTCNPPSATCFRKMRDLLRFEASATGNRCLQLLQTVSTELRENVASAILDGFCNSHCGANVSLYLELLMDAKCTDWRAVRTTKLRYDLTCHAVQGTRCAAVFTLDRFRDTLRAAINPPSGSSVSQIERNLSLFCSPCFHDHLRLLNQYDVADKQDLLITWERLCVKDSSLFCNPRYNDVVATTGDAGVNVRARAHCNVSAMRRCSARSQIRDVLALEPSADSTATQTEIASLQTEIETQCLEQPGVLTSRGEPQLCADVMEPLLRLSTACAADDTNCERFTEMETACATVGENSTCPWGCQRRYGPERDRFGCCYRAVHGQLQSLQRTDLLENFSRTLTIAAECNRPADAACTILDYTGGVGASLPVQVPVEFLKKNTTTIFEAVSRDVRRAVGQTSAGVYVTDYRFVTLTTSTVGVVLLGQSRDSALRIKEQLDRDVDNGAIVFLDTERLFHSTCHTSRGRPC
eukprot:m.632656 g.632656  ORF g.632656 m.632656 type:complete len:572 (+) comp22578_c0_seq1:319-2034(+)